MKFEFSRKIEKMIFFFFFIILIHSCSFFFPFFFKQQQLNGWGLAQPTGATDFFGGNFEGVMEKIQYLKQLGINGVYFTPIFSAPSNHKYDTVGKSFFKRDFWLEFV